MSGWGLFGSDSKASPSSSSKANGMQQKSNKGPAAGRSRDPAASAMAASLGLDVSAFDMPADGQHEMMHENLIDGTHAILKSGPTEFVAERTRFRCSNDLRNENIIFSQNYHLLHRILVAVCYFAHDFRFPVLRGAQKPRFRRRSDWSRSHSKRSMIQNCPTRIWRTLNYWPSWHTSKVVATRRWQNITMVRPTSFL